MITRAQLLELCEEELDKLLDGRKGLAMDRGSISFTVMVENGKVSTRVREKEIENEKRK